MFLFIQSNVVFHPLLRKWFRARSERGVTYSRSTALRIYSGSVFLCFIPLRLELYVSPSFFSVWAWRWIRFILLEDLRAFVSINVPRQCQPCSYHEMEPVKMTYPEYFATFYLKSIADELLFYSKVILFLF